MGKASVKENKNIYYKLREELNLSREAASELLVTLSPERIECIENEKQYPNPDDILAMAKGYKFPGLCNHYCANVCPIGKESVTEIKVKDLSQIILEILASLNAMKNSQEKLIEITADGVIDDEELKDFVFIQKELERISVTVETLQLWVAQMIADGKINMKKYEAIKKEE